MPNEKPEVEVLVPPGDPKRSLKFQNSTEIRKSTSAVKTTENDKKKSYAVRKSRSKSRTGAAPARGEHQRRKSRHKMKKTQEELNRLKAQRLKRVMQPLIEKCIPDVDRAPKKELTEAEAKAAADLRRFKRKPKEDDVYRRSSNLVFVMPKIRDPEEIQKRRTDKMVQKLIKYMKKSWKVKVDPKQADRELVYRTINTVTTKKPDNWKELVEQREQVAVETGYFCGFDGPYAPLINLELDTPMLVFNNLAPDLKITAMKWLRDKATKEELKRKRDAYLPRLPRNKLKRPTCARGRLLKDPGGIQGVDEFVQVAEIFQKLTRGDASYAKVLTEYVQKKEEDNENINSGFGVIRGDLKYGFKATGTPDDGQVAEDSYAEGASTSAGRSERRDSVTDGRKYQRDMLNMEYMINAIFDLVKSILNIKMQQLNSPLPMATEIVMQLRSDSPSAKSRKKTLPPMSVLKRAKRNPDIYTNAPTLISTVVPSTIMSNVNSEETSGESDDEDCIDELEDDFKKTKQAGVHIDLRSKLAVPSKLGVNDVITMSPVRSSTQVIAKIKRAHSLNELLAQKDKNSLSAQQKIKQLSETPEHAAIRLARNAATYAKLFERHKKMKRPIWQNVNVENFSSLLPEKPQTVSTKDPTNLTEADAEEMVELAMRKRQTFQSNKRWPNESQIMTPVFPFDPSATKINSEEQSRRNLLAKAANIDEIPPTPVRRLYKLAGVRTTDKQTFNALLDMKRAFRATEKKVRVFYENEISKMDWDTMRRFRCKVNAIMPDPVFQWTIAIMRQAMKYSIDEDVNNEGQTEGAVKRQAVWYRKLTEECSQVGALHHNGCQDALAKLMKFCDVDLKSRSHMLSRLALLVVSLPTTELGSRHWQQAIVFLLENLFGAPVEMLYQWLTFRGLPYLA